MPSTDSFPWRKGCICAALALTLGLSLAGCASSSGARRSKAVSPSSPASEAMTRAIEEFSRGRGAAISGDLQCAEDAFGRALQTVRPAGGPAPTDPEFIAFSTDLYEGILRYEALASPVEAEASEEGQGTPVISFPEAPAVSEQALLEARQAVSSDESSALSDLPMVINDAVLRIVAKYQNDYHDVIGRGIARSGRFLPMIRRVFEEQGLPKDLAQVAMVESSFIPHARSNKTASGLWQFMPKTGRQYGLTCNAVVDERNDPEKATRASARHLAYLHELFHDWYLAVAAYNAGEGRILRAMQKTGLSDFWQLAASGVLKPETQNYVPAVIAATLISKNPNHYGFEIEYEKPLEYETVKLDRPVNLKHLAVGEEVAFEELQRLNPELRNDVTPRQPEGYLLKVPVGGRSGVLVAFSQAPTARPLAWRRHVAKRGETLASIAHRFHVSLASLAASNSLPARGMLPRGSVVEIPSRQPARASTALAPKGKRSSSGRVAEAPPSQAYKVRGGDTLYRIALRHGLTVAQIIAVNGLPSAGTIKPGDQLKIPIRSR